MSISSIAVRPSAAAAPEAPDRTRLGVPWRPVLVLAVVLAYADGFWLTALRGAIGAIERTQSPFVSWSRESTLMLPVFVLAVLGALTLAKRWFGPVLRTPKSLAATALLVIAAGTLAGLAEIVVSAVYDYHLQAQQIRMMDAMRSICTGSCLDQELHATLVGHVRGVVLIGRWLLLTNLVAVVWIVAMLGGRLEVTRARVARAVAGSRTGDLRMLVVVSLVTAAAVHVAVVPEHLSEWPAAGMFFILLSIWELAVAGLLLTRIEERMMLLAAAAVSVGPLVLWTVSRTVGLPFGPEPGAAEAIGLPDVAACGLELVSLLAAVALLRGSGRLHRPAASAHARSLVVVGLLALTTIGVAGVGLSWFDAFGLSAVRNVMDMSTH